MVPQQEDIISQKIERVLGRVQDPQSLLSVSELGWISRVRYLPAFDKLEVETDINSPRFTCALCGIITASLRETIHRLLNEEFRKEFPGTNIVVSQKGVE
jgi:metal-sulfur cluster biosynthetic enzyme